MPLRRSLFPYLFAALCCSLLSCLAPGQDLSATSKEVARTPPAWMQQSIIYEVFPRDFSQAGTLNAVTSRLDDLHATGINTLWIMPVHPIGQLHRIGPLGSPYAPRDYYAIDPALGTKEDLTRLVDAAHAHGMRVLLDMVADHTSPDSPLVAAHPDFYLHDAAGKLVQPQGWSDVAGLNYANPALRQYMVDMFVYWLRTFHLDGFRCDAATFVPTSFWEQLRPPLQAVKPDVLLLAEASKPELMTRAFDLDYGWPLLHTFNDILEDGAPATELQRTLVEQQRAFPHGTQHLLISDDHDEIRATVRYGIHGALAASALVFTLPGVPMLYNGMEVGDATPSGAPALFEKFKLYWGAGQQERESPGFYRALLALRASSPALQSGSLQWLHNSNEQHIVSFLRHTAGEDVLVAVNLSNTPFRGSLEVPTSTNWKEVTLHSESGAHHGPEPTALPALSLNAFQVRLFRSVPHQP